VFTHKQIHQKPFVTFAPVRHSTTCLNKYEAKTMIQSNIIQ